MNLPKLRVQKVASWNSQNLPYLEAASHDKDARVGSSAKFDESKPFDPAPCILS